MEYYKLWLILLTLIGSAFFSGSETALISINRVKLQSWIGKTKRLSKLADSFLNRPGDLLSSLLVGNNLMNVLLTVLIADLIIEMFPEREALSILVTVLVIPALTMPPTLFFGEIIPKSIAREHAGRLLPLLTTPLLVCHYLLTPVVKVVHGMTSLVLKFSGVKSRKPEMIFTRKNIQQVLLESKSSGLLDEEERNYISGVFEFSESTVREVMTPRIEIEAVPRGTSMDEIADKINQSNYSRIPIYEDSLDHIIGIVHVVDLLSGSGSGEPVIHPVIFTPETRKCDSLFNEMRQKKCHLAVVLDEYGGTSGIVTLEDLLEELVGDIHDVHDATGSLVKIGRDNSIIVDGRTRIDELEGKIELPETEYEVETIGGLLVSELGRIPDQGERFQLGRVRITVLETSPKHVVSLRLRQIESAVNEPEANESSIRPIREEED